jgi:uncharacterized delta-60 repeat protein
VKRLAHGLAAFAATLLFATAVSAAAGDLDPTFAGDGTVIADFEGGSYDLGRGVAVQRDRKIVVAGLTQSAGDDAFALVRYSADGTLDATFDGDGKVRTDFAPSSYEGAEAVALQSDGKIVVAGGVAIPSSSTGDDFGLVRYNADGTLDTSFDGDGKVVTDFAGGFGVLDGARSVAVQPDGKIVAAGLSGAPECCTFDFAVARYNSDGSLDTSFGGDGTVVTPISPGSEFAADVVVQPDGKLVVGGDVGSSGGAMLVRYTGDGGLDSSFDGDGKVVLTSPTSSISRLAFQSDGKIVAAGSRGMFSVTRFNPDGSVDTSFGDGGIATAPFTPSSYSSAVAIQADGKIVAGGIGAAGHNFAVARFQQRGTLDRSFSSDGMVESVLGGPGGRDVAYDLGLAPDGKIILAGGSRSTSSGPYDFAVARYLAALPPCKVPNVRGKKLAAAKASIKRARCAVGRVTRKPSNRVKKGRVISQSPKAAKTLPNGSKVKLVVSKGRKR